MLEEIIFDGKDLLEEAKKTLQNAKSTAYSHQTKIDESKGIYCFDCSGFVGYVLIKVRPDAQADIPHPGYARPRAKDFYNYCSKLSKTPNNVGWSRLRRPATLLPGDIIAWLQPPDSANKDDTGHVMMVRDTPVSNPNRKNEILVVVIDSASSPHANDSRDKGSTGLGTGTIGISIDDGDKPVGFFWRGGRSKKLQKTKIAFGRLNGPT